MTEEQPVQILYDLTDYDDEYACHDQTLEGIARYLAHGDKHDQDGVQMLPKGDTTPLKERHLFADRTLRRIGETFDWEISPPLPEGCDFMAIRCGPGCGWSAESILLFGHGNDRSIYTDNECQLGAWTDGADILENVAVGKTVDRGQRIGWWEHTNDETNVIGHFIVSQRGAAAVIAGPEHWLTLEKGASIAGLAPLSLQGMDWPMTVVIHGPTLTGENEYHPDLAITLWPNAAMPWLEMAIRADRWKPWPHSTTPKTKR